MFSNYNLIIYIYFLSNKLQLSKLITYIFL